MLQLSKFTEPTASHAAGWHRHGHTDRQLAASQMVRGCMLLSSVDIILYGSFLFIFLAFLLLFTCRVLHVRILPDGICLSSALPCVWCSLLLKSRNIWQLKLWPVLLGRTSPHPRNLFVYTYYKMRAFELLFSFSLLKDTLGLGKNDEVPLFY